MAKDDSATESRGMARRAYTAKRRAREAGTTLVEILVVIVIFLIGILAVVQIFPGGFRLLLTTRNNSAATALGRDLVERLKDNPDLIPDEIVTVRYSGGTPLVDATLDPLGLDPLGNGIDPDGALKSGGALVTRDWMLSAGPNRARRIVGEGHRLPAARAVGALNDIESYGSLLVLDHGPVAVKSPLVAYANDLSRSVGAPRDVANVLSDPNNPSSVVAVPLETRDGNDNLTNFAGTEATSPVSITPYEFFVVGADGSDAAILLPANHLVARRYRVRMSAYLGTNASVKRYEYLSLNVTVPAVADTTVPLVRVPLGPLLSGTTEYANGALYGVEAESIRVAPQFRQVEGWTLAANGAAIDPFEMKVVDGNLGVLLFSPAGRQGVVDRPGATSEPLVARVDYDVRDWRILGEEFRVVDGTRPFTFPVAIQSLKVGSNAGVDGRPNGGMFGAGSIVPAGDSYDPSSTPRDNVVVVDLTTGFEVQRYATSGTHADGATVNGTPSTRTDADEPGGADAAKVLVSVDKSRGSVTLREIDPQRGLVVRLINPFGGVLTVPAQNRAFRVLYRARQEWSVQMFKGASQYVLVSAQPDAMAPDQAYIGTGDGTYSNQRIYFTKGEAGHKVTVDRIAYYDKNGDPQVLEGQDFVIRPAKAGETSSLPYVDLTEVVGKSATLSLPRFDYRYGSPVQGIKGASLSVRVLWNPDTFSLGPDPATNLQRASVWGRSWRKSTTETYLRAEETR